MGVLGDMEGGQIYWTEKGKKMRAYSALLESCIEYTIVNIPPTPLLALSPSPPILKYRNATFSGNFGESYCTEREFKYILKVLAQINENSGYSIKFKYILKVFAHINENSRYSIKFKYILKVLAEVNEKTHVTVSNSSTF